ncbi:prohibitin family protein [Oscillatoria amoena NRMC-F 0135]|nr:prohibitin family protein [Oscillatoria amoena NRMC-F 0135]
MKVNTLCIILITATLLFSGCAKIIQDEVGVKRTFGRLNKNTLSPGLRFFNPFASTIIKVPVRTINLQIEAGLPSKEGLTIKSEISILYSVKKEEVPKILETVGLDFQEVLILPVFRSASADVCARFFAKDMHSSERAKIEKEIKEKMMDVLSERGFNIEAVLMKSITLPPSLSKAIEDKLSAEQEALRMEFILDRERREAERRAIEAEGKKKAAVIAAEADKQVVIIAAEGKRQASILEAEGTKEANDLLNKSLGPLTIKYYQIEAFKDLCTSPNAKTIITDGKTPFLTMPD